jgi:beta-galactosidase
MKNNIISIIQGFLISVILFTACTRIQKSGIERLPLSGDPRMEILFDFGWQFNRGDVENGESIDLDDSSWRLLDLPHDWSIEDIPGTDSPLDSNSIGGIDAGYTVGGTGWYRKTFFVPGRLDGKRLHLQFDGIYMNADIWLNGQHLGNHPYGYTSFWYDITDNVQFGSENILAVEVKNEGRNSRWYSGSGIYRHVWLKILNPVFIEQWGTYITTPDVSSSLAKVNVRTTMFNGSGADGEYVLTVTILDPQGTEVVKSSVNQSVDAGTSYEFTNALDVSSPQLWSTETPVLYKAVCEITSVGDENTPALLDRVETNFGIRTISFDAGKGLLLNGKPVLLKGGCMHHDNGPLGAAAYDRAEERRVELMKASGYNSIRCSHNPPSPGFLDACDRLGILVINESFDMWAKQKNPQDYHLYFNEWWQKDLESMVLRDRNHPSVIMWSIGNEIPERGEPSGVELARKQSDYVRSMDPARPITSAVNGIDPDKDPYFATLDICGYNYARDHYVSDHKRLPDRIIVATESFPLEAFEYWMAVLDYPFVIGDYVWTGYDYLGEASIGWLGYWHSSNFYPWMHAYCGDIDICGFKRPPSYYRDALWGDDKNVSIFVKPPVPSFDMVNPDHADWSIWHWQDVVADWTWPGYENTPMDIEVYSNCSEVELFQDNKSLGKKSNSRETEFITRWNVPYQPGVLKAVAYENGIEVATSELKSAGKPAKVLLTGDRIDLNADGQDLSFITVEILDGNSIRNPKATNTVLFEIEGPGSIIAVGSSNPFGLESFVQPKRNAYQGRCLVIVRSAREPGNITLTASSEGLQSDQVTIEVK